MMAYSEDQIALAAEYAVGTLDAEERLQAETMMSADKEFAAMVERSEEHTSELQSQSNLVCRLLLEKKHNILLLLADHLPELERQCRGDRDGDGNRFVIMVDLF